MKKRDILVFAAIVLVFILILLIPDNVSAENRTSSGIVSLFIENNSCGNGFCTSEEDCNNCPQDCGACLSPPSGGVGGAFAGIIRLKNLTINKDLIKVTLKQGESKREILIINNGDKGVRINLSVDSELLKKHMIISEESFYLTGGEIKRINIDFFAKEDELADTYLGRIIVSYGDLKKIINVILEVKEKKALFDILTKVQNPFTAPGRNVSAVIKITNLGELGNIDITLYYAIKDFNNSVLTFREETLAINKELIVTREFKLPKNFPIGKYVFYSRVNYGRNQTASSSDVFEVLSEWDLILRNIAIIITIIISIILIIIIILLLRRAAKKYRELKSLGEIPE